MTVTLDPRGLDNRRFGKTRPVEAKRPCCFSDVGVQRQIYFHATHDDLKMPSIEQCKSGASPEQELSDTISLPSHVAGSGNLDRLEDTARDCARATASDTSLKTYAKLSSPRSGLLPSRLPLPEVREGWSPGEADEGALAP